MGAEFRSSTGEPDPSTHGNFSARDDKAFFGEVGILVSHLSRLDCDEWGTFDLSRGCLAVINATADHSLRSSE